MGQPKRQLPLIHGTIFWPKRTTRKIRRRKGRRGHNYPGQTNTHATTENQKVILIPYINPNLTVTKFCTDNIKPYIWYMKNLSLKQKKETAEQSSTETYLRHLLLHLGWLFFSHIDCPFKSSKNNRSTLKIRKWKQSIPFLFDKFK